MFVTKRSGAVESVDLSKITNSLTRIAVDGLMGLDIYKVAITTISGLYEGVSTKELDLLSIKTAAGLIIEDNLYSKLAARILSNYIKKEVQSHDIKSFSQSIKLNYENGLISESTYKFVKENARKLDNAIDEEKNKLFEYYGLQTVYDRYLLRHPELRTVTEEPQYWLLRVACGLSETVKEAIEFYNLLSSHEYMTSTPTLFNSGTKHSQMSSCYLLDSPKDDLCDIYKRYSDIAMLSKWAGGIGLSYSKVRGSGSLIKGTNGKSNGIIPFIHTLDSSVKAVNQCFIPGTLVDTPNGKTKIDELKEGDEIINTYGVDIVKEIMKSEYSGMLIVLNVRGKEYKMTPEHPILVIANGKDHSDEVLRYRLKNGISKPEWKEAQGINNNDVILYLGESDVSMCDLSGEI